MAPIQWIVAVICYLTISYFTSKTNMVVIEFVLQVI